MQQKFQQQLSSNDKQSISHSFGSYVIWTCSLLALSSYFRLLYFGEKIFLTFINSEADIASPSTLVNKMHKSCLQSFNSYFLLVLFSNFWATFFGNKIFLTFINSVADIASPSTLVNKMHKRIDICSTLPTSDNGGTLNHLEKINKQLLQL